MAASRRHPWSAMMYSENLAPPDDAVVLFDGAGLSNGTTRAGGPAAWTVADGILHVVPGAGDIVTRQRLMDFILHLEFHCPDLPAATGQAKGNSGVFLQGRYEIQVLDSHGWRRPGLQFAPLVAACLPAMEWQTYDVVFRAPRPGESGPPLTVLHNGRVVHNNVQLPGVTGAALDDRLHTPGPLLLQDHGDLVCYRNIWAVELPAEGSKTYEPH